MTNNNFHIAVSVKGSPEEAITRINEVNKWWAKDVTGESKKLGDKFTVHFGQTFVDFTISQLVPGKKTAWKVENCFLHWIDNKTEWNGTEVVYEVTKKGTYSQIDFTHVGLVPGIECFESCEEGWSHHLVDSLVDLINVGKGTPE